MWGISGLAGGMSWASDSPSERATLRGLEGVYVLIESLDPKVEQAGLTTQQLQTDVELRLRLAGIRVLTDEESRRTPGNPCLYVNVNVLLQSDGRAAYSVKVALEQRAALETDSSLATVGTWGVGSIGTVGRARLDSIRNHLRDEIDKFINAYLSVRPRSAGNRTPSSTSSRR
jgi:hypothetical protein